MAILTLALGIGATTAIFTVVNAVVLSPLPFVDADRLVEIRIISQNDEGFPLPDADFIAWRDGNQTCDAVAVYDRGSATLTGQGDAERIAVAQVTGQFFHVFGARPLVGRVFHDGDDKPAAAKAAVLSHAFWMRRFHGDANVIGRTIAINGVERAIVGVMPDGFRFPQDIDVWSTLTIETPTRRGPFYTTGVGRLKPGVSMSELRANLGAIAAGLKRQYPGPEDWTLDAVSLQDAVVGDTRRVLYVLLAAVGFLLLISTVNVANLLLARAVTREREIAVRGALGAGRGRIAAQLVTESVVLAVAAGVLGLVFAWWGTQALVALAPRGIPRLGEVRMNTTVFFFALAAAAACGVAFGLAPALRASRLPLVDTLKEAGRSATGGRRTLQQLLVVAEIALALMLAVGAGLMIRSFAELRKVTPGFDPGRLLTFQLALPSAQYSQDRQIRAFFDALVQRLETLPGVRSVGLTISLPPDQLYITDNFMVEGQVLRRNQSAPVGPVLMVNDTFFATLGVPLVRGRVFDERDEAGRDETVIINETLARRFYPGVDPIGRRFKIGGPERPIGPNNKWKTVVGVVGDIKYSGLDTPAEPTYYLPYRQSPFDQQFVVVRTAGDPAALAPSIKQVVASLDKDVPVARLRTMNQLMDASVAPPKFRMLLVSIFAAVGLLLAAIGTYGVLSYIVSDRTRELGLRVALGATSRDVVTLVLREVLALAATGVALGIVGALATTKLIGTLLFGVQPHDAATFATIAAVVAATALVAGYVPARRATRADPMAALRSE